MSPVAPTAQIRELARNEMFTFLKSFPETSIITVIVEKSLVSALDVNFKLKELEELGVASIRPWEGGAVSETSSANASVVVYILRSFSKDTFGLISGLVSLGKGAANKAPQRCLMFCPTVMSSVTDRLPLGAFSQVSCFQWLDSTALDADVLSLQLPSGSLCDDSELEGMVSLMSRLQAEFGLGVGHEQVLRSERRFRKINAIGPKGKRICDLFLQQEELEQRGLNVGSLAPPEGGDGGMSEDHQVTAGITRMGGIRTVGNFFASGQNYSSIACNDDDHNAATIKPAPVDSVVIIDRTTDLFSVLCSQFTYASQLDEVWGIVNNRVTYRTSDVGGKTGTTGDPTTASVNKTVSVSSDSLYDEIKDVSINQIGHLLAQKTAYISESYKEKDSLQSISQVKDFMDKFKLIQAQHASLSSHVELATECSHKMRLPETAYMLKLEDQIMSMAKPVGKIFWKLEKLIRYNVSFNKVAQLFCLTTLVYGARVPVALVERLTKALVHRYGIGILRKLILLEQNEILKVHKGSSLGAAAMSGIVTDLISSGGTKWPKLREDFKLIIDSTGKDFDIVNAPLAEPYSGYVPISVRLVQLINTSWKSAAEKLKLLKGPAIEVVQECPIAAQAFPTSGGADSSHVLVVFVGGVTYSEIAALRKLSEIEGYKRKFLIVTSSITSYAKMIDGV